MFANQEKESKKGVRNGKGKETSQAKGKEKGKDKSKEKGDKGKELGKGKGKELGKGKGKEQGKGKEIKATGDQGDADPLAGQGMLERARVCSHIDGHAIAVVFLLPGKVRTPGQPLWQCGTKNDFSKRRKRKKSSTAVICSAIFVGRGLTLELIAMATSTFQVNMNIHEHPAQIFPKSMPKDFVCKKIFHTWWNFLVFSLWCFKDLGQVARCRKARGWPRSCEAGSGWAKTLGGAAGA